MYGISVARSASATTSLPNPAAFTPAGTGRSSSDKLPLAAGRVFPLLLLLLAKVWAPPFAALGGGSVGIQPDYGP